MNGPRSIPIHQSLTRPLLLAGAERELVLVNGVLSFALVFGIGSWQAMVIGVFFAIVVQSLLVQLAKKDTQFSSICVRHFAYSQSYYPPQAMHCAPSPLVKYHTV